MIKLIIKCLLIVILALASFNIEAKAKGSSINIEQNLTQEFQGIALKTISKSEVLNNPKSNRHEFLGVKDFREVLGEDKQKFKTTFIYLDDVRKIKDESSVTWYSIKNKKNYKRYALYYKDNEVVKLMNAGDLLFFGKIDDENAVVIIAKSDSTVAKGLLKGLNIESQQPITKIKDVSQDKDLQELDIKLYKNIKTGKIIVSGFVSKITDGDTIVIEDFFKIRMYGIDAPEKRQKCQDKKGIEYACGLDATAKLTKLIGKKRITCIHHTSEKYGRFVFQCKNAQGVDVNQMMVKSGMAVSEYGADYQKDEEIAKENKIGIWSGNFIRPNEWRKGKR